MRKLVVLLCFTEFIWILPSLAAGALLRYEPFDYSDVGATVEGKTNPDGETWVSAYASTAPNAINVASGNLSMPPEMNPPVGNSAEINGSGNGAGKALRLPLGETLSAGSVYYSLGLRIDELTGSTNVVGGFFIGLNNSGVATTANPTAAGARLQARIDPTDGTKYNLGIFRNVNASAAATSWSGPLGVGETHFVVASYEIVSGTQNDVARLWINPVLNGSEPAATLTDSTTGTGSDINIASIILRQGPAPHVTLDELRVGTTWQSVIPEPASIFLMAVGCIVLIARRGLTRH